MKSHFIIVFPRAQREQRCTSLALLFSFFLADFLTNAVYRHRLDDSIHCHRDGLLAVFNNPTIDVINF